MIQVAEFRILREFMLPLLVEIHVEPHVWCHFGQRWDWHARLCLNRPFPPYLDTFEPDSQLVSKSGQRVINLA